MPAARRTDPKTSHDAARSVKATSTVHLGIMYVLRWGGLTDTDLITRYNRAGGKRASDSSIRSRRAELVRAGIVVDTGARQKLASGRQSIVWGLREEINGQS